MPMPGEEMGAGMEPAIEIPAVPAEPPQTVDAEDDLSFDLAAETPPPASVEEEIPAVEPAPVMAEPAPPPVSEAANEALTQNLAALEARIAELNALVTEKMQDSESRMAEMSGALKTLEDRVGDLSRSVEDVKSAPASAAAPAPPPMKAAPAAPLTTHRSPETTAWVLRSAQRGKAVLSPRGSSDLRTVEVGDTLSGLGRITAIDLENGRWVVRGTQGTVAR
jgi:intracellular multiplication protein IcmG